MIWMTFVGRYDGKLIFVEHSGHIAQPIIQRHLGNTTTVKQFNNLLFLTYLYLNNSYNLHCLRSVELTEIKLFSSLLSAQEELENYLIAFQNSWTESVLKRGQDFLF